MNPIDLGYVEKRPGSGIWSHPERGGSFDPRVCENPECGEEFMGRRVKDQGMYCSIRCSNWKQDAGYKALHLRVRAALGLASDYACIDCGGQARQWSYDGNDPDDEVDAESGCRFSRKLHEHYVPRCVKCHRAHDGGRGETHGQAVLTEAQVRGIHASAGASLREIADLHGTSKTNVCRIRRGDTWQHITTRGPL